MSNYTQSTKPVEPLTQFARKICRHRNYNGHTSRDVIMFETVNFRSKYGKGIYSNCNDNDNNDSNDNNNDKIIIMII